MSDLGEGERDSNSQQAATPEAAVNTVPTTPTPEGAKGGKIFTLKQPDRAGQQADADPGIKRFRFDDEDEDGNPLNTQSAIDRAAAQGITLVKGTEAAVKKSAEAVKALGTPDQQKQKYDSQVASLPTDLKGATTQKEAQDQLLAMAQEKAYQDLADQHFDEYFEEFKKNGFDDAEATEKAEDRIRKEAMTVGERQVLTFWDRVKDEAKKQGKVIGDDAIKDMRTGNFQELLDTLFGPGGGSGRAGGGTESGHGAEGEQVKRDGLLSVLWKNNHIDTGLFTSMVDYIYGDRGLLEKVGQDWQDKLEAAGNDSEKMHELVRELVETVEVKKNEKDGWTKIQKGLASWWHLDPRLNRAPDMAFDQEDFEILLKQMRDEYQKFFGKSFASNTSGNASAHAA